MHYVLEEQHMGDCRSFRQFWDTLPVEMREKMNPGDAEYIWMARAHDIRQARLDGRKAALQELQHEFNSHDYFSEAGMVRAFYMTDVSYTGEYDEKH